MFKYLFLFLFSTTISFGQFNNPDYPMINDSSLLVADYWETDLTPLSELTELVNFIHNDPYKSQFIGFIPAGNPLVREISVNSFYGSRMHPVHGVIKFHRGIDLKGTYGEHVVASGKGVVLETGFKADLGKYIKIKHSYGFESIYGHLNAINVKKGQKVNKNQLIGKVGATGKVTGPHLHYTLKKNQLYLDPFDFLFMIFEKEW
jgi:murein DD-endopeptidase MepM/ murein hydrolase activator NlpD